MTNQFKLLCSLSLVGALQAMDQQPNITQYSSASEGFVIKQTGLGSTARTELIHDPLLAQMMREMNKAEADCYAREKKAHQDRKAAKEEEQKKAERSFGSGFKKGFLSKKADKK